MTLKIKLSGKYWTSKHLIGLNNVYSNVMYVALKIFNISLKQKIDI